MDIRNILGKLDQLSEGTMASAKKKPTGPKFVGKMKGTDPASAAKSKYVGGESILRDLEAKLNEEPEKRDLMKEFREFKEARAATASFRAGNNKRAALNAMSDEERRAYDKEQQEKQRKRDDARLERERQKLAAKKGAVKESSDIERKIHRTQQLIQDYYNRSRVTKNDIKRNHYIDMARQLEYDLEGMINDANQAEQDSWEVERHNAEPSATWNRGGLNEFAPGNGDDDDNYAEYVVYQCDPNDQFEFIGGPLYQSDNLGMAHKYAYEHFLRYRPKAFVVYQPHKEASRGNYGVKGESDSDELNEFAIDKEPEGDGRSKLVGAVAQLLKAKKKVDFFVPGIRGHVIGIGGQGDWLTLKRWNKPYSKINYSLALDASDDNRFALKMIKPDYYQVVEKGTLDEGWKQKALAGLSASAMAMAPGTSHGIAGAFPTPSAQQQMYKAAADSNRAMAAQEVERQRQANAARASKLAADTKDLERLNRVNYHGKDAPKPTNAEWDGDSDFLELDGTQYSMAMRMPISGDVPSDIKLIATKEGRQVYIWTRRSLKGVQGHYFYPAKNPKTIGETFTDLELAVMEGGHELIKENPVAPAAPAQPGKPTLGTDLTKPAGQQDAEQQQQDQKAQQLAAQKEKQEQATLQKGVNDLKSAGAAVSNPAQVVKAFDKAEDNAGLTPADKNSIASAGTVLAPIMANPALQGKFKDLVTQASAAQKKEQQQQAKQPQPATPAPVGPPK